jgi:DNA-binding MarR family transcriptional regulator
MASQADLAALALDWVRSPAYREITTRQMALLALICDEAGPHPVKCLAADLGVQKPVVTRIVTTFEIAKVARRVADPHDKRGVFVEPTEKGRALRRALAGLGEAA